MEIIKAPNPVLSQKAKLVQQINEQILSLIREMKQTLLDARDPEGVGLAAPQIGKSLQIFIIKQSQNAPITVYINPTVKLIQSTAVIQKNNPRKKSSNKLEGCLSLQNIWGTVTRAPKVEISYLDETGKSQTKTYAGFLATIIQHEYDHLQGILFPKRVLEQQGTLYKSSKGKAGEDIFTEIEL